MQMNFITLVRFSYHSKLQHDYLIQGFVLELKQGVELAVKVVFQLTHHILPHKMSTNNGLQICIAKFDDGVPVEELFVAWLEFWL